MVILFRDSSVMRDSILGEAKSKENLSPELTKHYKVGNQMVIHSMAEGVFMEDVLIFPAVIIS